MKKIVMIPNKQQEVLKDFCEFAKLQANLDAEIPNIQLGMRLCLEGIDVDVKDWNWDPLDDNTFLSPEALMYILLKAQQYFKPDSQRYEVFEEINDEKHIISYCEDLDSARTIAYLLAEKDPKDDEYYVKTNYNGEWCPGGGEYWSYKKKDGKVEEGYIG